MSCSVKPRPFISYAREDHEIASRLYEDLRALGVEPWLDKRDLIGGEDWQAAIRRAVQECSHFVALLSSNSVSKRGFVQKELRQALDILEEFPPGEIFVIPVRLEDAKPRLEALKRLHWIDLFPSYETGLRKLVKSLAAKSETAAASAWSLAMPGRGPAMEIARRFLPEPIHWIALTLVAVFILMLNGTNAPVTSKPRWSDQDNCRPDEQWLGMNPNTLERSFEATPEQAKRAIFHGELRWSPSIKLAKQTTVGEIELEVDGRQHVIYRWNSPTRSTHDFDIPLNRFLVGTSGHFRIRWKWENGTSGVCVARSDVKL
jgi:hypothetical protein